MRKSHGTNGVGDLLYKPSDAHPGDIAFFGVDDDVRVLIIANVEAATKNDLYFRYIYGLSISPDYKYLQVIRQGFSSSESISIERNMMTK